MDEYSFSKLPVGGVVPLQASHAGLMISRGRGRHMERTVGCFVLLFVREGTLHIEENGRQFEVQEGQTLLLWPGRLHRGTQDYGKNLKFFWLHFTVDATSEEEPLLNVPQLATLSRPDFVTALMRRYLDDQDTGRLEPLSAALYVWMILTEVSDARGAPQVRAASLAGRAYTHICTHFHQEITPSGLARVVGCNPQYLSRVFAQTHGQTLTQTIRRVRINHARSLLLHSNFNIGEIAGQCGFQDVAYFQRVFKQLEGVPPLHFRRLHARMNVNTE